MSTEPTRTKVKLVALSPLSMTLYIPNACKIGPRDKQGAEKRRVDVGRAACQGRAQPPPRGNVAVSMTNKTRIFFVIAAIYLEATGSTFVLFVSSPLSGNRKC